MVRLSVSYQEKYDNKNEMLTMCILLHFTVLYVIKVGTANYLGIVYLLLHALGVKSKDKRKGCTVVSQR